MCESNNFKESSNIFKQLIGVEQVGVEQCTQKRESFLGELPQVFPGEFVPESNSWSFLSGELWLCWIMLSVVLSYMEMKTWPWEVRWQFMWGN